MKDFEVTYTYSAMISAENEDEALEYMDHFIAEDSLDPMISIDGRGRNEI